MISQLARVTFASLLLAAITACSSSPAVPVDATVADGTSTTSFTATGLVSVQGGTADPIAGVNVCLDGLTAAAACATTAQDGSFSIPLSFPDDKVSQIALVMSVGGYLGREAVMSEDPTAANGHAISFGFVSTLLPTAAAATLLSTQAGFTYPTATNGFVNIQVFGASGLFVAASATIAPVGGGSGAGAVYTSSSHVPDKSLTDSSQDANVWFGDLIPGTYAITVQAPGKTCSAAASAAWAGSGGSTMNVEVRANTITGLSSVTCD